MDVVCVVAEAARCILGSLMGSISCILAQAFEVEAKHGKLFSLVKSNPTAGSRQSRDVTATTRAMTDSSMAQSLLTFRGASCRVGGGCPVARALTFWQMCTSALDFLKEGGS